MLPLKPPVSKINLKGITLINFPVVDDDGKILNENSWPKFHGIFNGNVVIVNDSNDKSRLSCLGSYGQLALLEKENCIDYKTLKNQLLHQKKNWQSMDLVPFLFPLNNVDNKNIENNPTTFENHVELSFLNQNSNIDNSHKINLIKQKCKEKVQKFNIDNTDNNDVKDRPANWKDFKTNFTKAYDKLLILSGCEQNVPYYLFLEEAFFLNYTLECLEIKAKNDLVLNAPTCWKLFNALKKDFPYFYAAYHYYRSKGWVVKPGKQYGGDYVLYKSLPIYYHSSYVVVINVNGKNSELLSSWPSFFGCSRASEAASKDLLICTVFGPAYEEGNPIDLTQYTVNDTIVRRWIPSQNRIKPEL